MLREILVVDDSEINRRILEKILSTDYKVIQAKNGKEALDILKSRQDGISAVLLDIVMPVMDGYGFLEAVREDDTLSKIPIIVTADETERTAEIRALSMGANDFAAKPYNPPVLKRRLMNTINLYENSVIANAVSIDTLTGLYSRDAFLCRTAEMVSAHDAGYYVMSCFDIDNFKVINDQYGNSTGDKVLKFVADIFRNGFGAAGGICCRINADIFAVLYPKSFIGSRKLSGMRRELSELDGSILPISFSIGRYIIDDVTLSPSAMYDRAAIAKASVKGRFDEHIAMYDESMRLHLLKEQKIISEMNSALESEQFEVWFQPQYNHSTGALIGAEALVRWRHPIRGLILPGEFIPVFEKNGFVYELDKYVWRQVCAMLRDWIDEGFYVLPVSVNISRHDILRSDLIDVIIDLVREYGIPSELLRLEVTESAFVNSLDKIIHVVKTLISYGFTVEIDDFGSGYSSLNTLKDVPAQILKLDMRFFEGDDLSGRGGNIIESIVRMAKWLDMSVIAEGVEFKEQADFLRSISCDYVQGYLYAKPMPAEEYEELSNSSDKEKKLIALETVETLDNNAFWNPKSMDTLIFNSYVGAACIFEYHNSFIELIRVTKKFSRMLGNARITIAEALKTPWIEYLDNESREALINDIQTSVETRDEVSNEYILRLPPVFEKITHLRSTLRVIAVAGERHLVYCTIENITAQREAEKKEYNMSERLRILMESINGGVTATIVRRGIPSFIYVNENFFSQLGFTKAQYEKEVKNPHDLLHPDDRERIVAQTDEASKTRTPFTAEYRVIRRDGTIRWWRSNISVTTFPGVDEPVQLAVANDITPQHDAEDTASAALEQLKLVTSLVDDSSSGVYVCDLESHEMLYVNSRCAEICRKTIEEAEGQHCYTFLKGLSEPCSNCCMETSDADNYSVHEYTDTLNGRHYMIKGKRINWGGRPAFVIYLSDETENTNTRLRLQALYRGMEMATRNSDISFWQYDLDKRLLTNGQTNHMGFPAVYENVPDALIDNGDIHSADAEKFMRMFDELFGGAESCDCTVRLMNRNTGKYLWHHIVYTRIYDQYYSTRQAIGTSTNVELHKEAKMRYEHELQLRRELIKDSVNYYEINLTENVIIEYQSTFSDVSGIKTFASVTPQVSEAILENVVESDREAVKDMLFCDGLRNAFDRGETSVELIYRRIIPGGDIHWIKASASIMKRPVTDDVVAFLYFRDIDSEETKRRAVDSIISKETDAIAVINLMTERVRIIGIRNGSDGGKSRDINYAEHIAERGMSEVAKEDRGEFISFFSLGNLKKQLSSKPSAAFTYRTNSSDGAIRRMRTIVYYLDDTKTKIVLSRRDITGIYEEEQRQKSELRKAVETANEANNAKSDFLSRMSHDMRTPMNAIIGLLNLARVSTNPEKTEYYLDSIDSSSHFLLGLINDVLDLSRIEQGKIDLHEEPFTLDAFLLNIKNVIRPLMDEKNIDFIIDIGTGVSCITVDRLRYNQIFFNLLSNAAKYTPQNGKVEFITRSIPDKDGKVGIRHIVRDNGCGMSRDFLKIAFNPFEQERSDAVSELQGTGLGLAIVKNLVNAMGGSISVKSTLGKGTEFVIDLYLPEADESAASERAGADDYSLPEGLNVLLVDDNTMNIVVEQNLLEHSGCIVSVARNGLLATELFEASEVGYFGIILMDIRMPVMNGLDATKKIRSLDRTDAKTVPIIAMTADAFSADRNLTVEAGMSAHVAKPIEPLLLYETIRKCLGIGKEE